MPKILRNTSLFLLVAVVLAVPALADRTILKPGWNIFSTPEDIEMGRILSEEAAGILPLIDQPNLNSYINALGTQLARHAPGERYPYEFKIVDDDAINSFALPGGQIYVTKGLIQAAQSEPQLAGILAHQIGHVALRHGTEQVSNLYRKRARNVNRLSVPVSTVMSELDIHFEDNPVVLAFSLEAERQADLLGAQIMHDAGFDPRQMTQMLQTVTSRSSGLAREFSANHPSAANRAARVRLEIQKMGGLPRNLRGDSGDFHSVKERLADWSTAPPRFDPDRGGHITGDAPSSRTALYRGYDIEFRYPENWSVSEEADGVYVVPEGGLVSGGLAYGMRIATFDPLDDRFLGRTPFAVPNSPPAQTALADATDELLNELRRSNPNMRVVRTNRNRQVDGSTAMALDITNDSPLGGQETNWLVTTLRPDGTLYYFVGVAPQREFNRYLPAFERIVASVRFTR